MITQSQMFCLGAVMLAITGSLHKINGAAQAQTPSSTYICMFEASAVTTTDKEDCIRRGGQLQPLYSSTMGGSITLSTAPGTSITNSVRSCDEGWTLVATGRGYKCARELREPK